MAVVRRFRRVVGVMIGIVPLMLFGVEPALAAPLDFGSSSSGSAGSAGCTATAAERHGWGTPDRSDDFDHASSLNNWLVYDGPGHVNNGRRTPDAVTVSDGNLVISADLAGNSGGLTPNWGGRMHGRWEICARSTIAGPAWTAAALLWPDAEDWPAGGEVDFMEISDPTRQTVSYFLHWGAENHIEQHTTVVNATQWHSWAVEWTPQRITVFRDGIAWGASVDVNRLPPRPMHLTLQLDNFGGITFPAGKMFVDRVAEYPL
jgi:Glycosyl hydrolases family 16